MFPEVDMLRASHFGSRPFGAVGSALACCNAIYYVGFANYIQLLYGFEMFWEIHL